LNKLLGYKDTVCVVTGVSSGMGKACAEELIELGAKVYGLDVVPVQIVGVNHFIKVNMGNKDSIDEAFSKLPEKIDRFFGFAGVSGEKTSPQETICINFLGNKYIMDHYLRSRIQENGAVMMCTSIGASRWYSSTNKPELEALVHAKNWDESLDVLDVICKDLPAGNAYTYSKRALGYYTTIFACEMTEKRVRVNCLKPGNTKSGLTDEFIKRYLELHPGETVEDYHKANGMIDIAVPHQMAEPAIFLNSDMASYISGAELTVDYAKDAAILCGIEKEDRWIGRKLVHTCEYAENLGGKIL